ncbi:MAG: ribonuclease Z [Calditrichaeota bacterium]|nr:MAG: ribonuclease Z [Calditrichota bacterium]MBL1206283.1 ribonuclease Z [Calditrichota bacterium]NOG46109.1 ribonuclease Z [Calditrichota bacterium]
MNITILGSGTMVSPFKRNPSGYLLESKKHKALLDCGPGVLQKLNQLNVDVLDIDSIFLSHFHQDHCSDVMAILMRRYLLKADSNQKMVLFGPVGLKYWFNCLSLTQGDWIKKLPPILIESDSSEYDWAGYKIKTQKTLHTENSIAYMFIGLKRFFYSGDTDYQDELVKFAHKADMAIVECSRSDKQAVDGHLTPAKLARFINNSGIKHTVVSHIYPENDTPDLKNRILKDNNFNLEIADDLMKLNLI